MPSKDEIIEALLGELAYARNCFTCKNSEKESCGKCEYEWRGVDAYREFDNQQRIMEELEEMAELEEMEFEDIWEIKQ